MKVNITSHKGTSNDVFVTDDSGNRVRGISSMKIHVDHKNRSRLDSPLIHADVEFSWVGLYLTDVEMRVQEDQLRQLAAAHGYQLVKMGAA